MRITRDQAGMIRKLATEIFGQDTQVYLFGSCTNDFLKGGDIDLYIQPGERDSLFRKRLRLASMLQMRLGEQKFDITLARDPERSIEQEAMTTGIRL